MNAERDVQHKEQQNISKKLLALALGFALIQGCAYESAHPQQSGDGEWLTVPIADDDYMDLYLLTEQKTGKRFLVNSRGGIVEVGK